MSVHARKLILAGALVLGFMAPSFGQTAEPPVKNQGTFEFYLGSYRISDERFKEVYKEGGSIQGIALSSALIAGFDFYAEIKAFYKIGTLTYTQEQTKLLLIPLSLGVRYVLPGDWLLPYAGGGADFCFYYENNPIATTMNIAKGYHLLGGLYIQFGKNSPLRLNGRVKYTRIKTTEDGVAVELGGLEYGAGIVIVF
jgi:hypothetical protein